MKKLSLFLVIIFPSFCLAQLNETFSDGNYTTNPIWYSSGSNFTVNAQKQLQSCATTSSTSFISTPSEALDEATWNFWVKINYNPSSYNYACIYLAADKNDIASGCNGYYVQIGGNNDEVSLYLQLGTNKTKIIDGLDKRTDRNIVEISIKVTRSTDGTFTLKSKLVDQTDFVTEGTVKNNEVRGSKYFGLLFTNSGTTGNAYYFDDIVVTGNKVPDTEMPTWTLLQLELPNKLKLQFSEEMDFSTATFTLNHDIGVPEKQEISTDGTGVDLTFTTPFEKGILYSLSTTGLRDLAGNELLTKEKEIGIVEKIAVGDVIINEVMFDNPLNSSEYVEIYNRSEKVLDVSGLIISTRKTDGTINSGEAIPSQTLMLPKGYLAVGENADLLFNYHNCPTESKILSANLTGLNNESATIVLVNAAKDTVYDEFTYNVKWHHPLVKNPKGVALERISPEASTQDPHNWHSASSETNYGTPGYRNSQYRESMSNATTEKWAWAEPEAFSPDNDGVDDVCLIHYKTDSQGYVANLLILNAVGEKVVQLASNQLLATEGYITWDGLNSKMKNANAGIYIVYFEIFNPINGLKKQLKLPIVVSSR
jgi:hypothetical protein